MIFYDIIFMENECKQCLQFVCKILKTNSTNNTKSVRTCGSGKKYKQCCGK